MKRTLTKKPDFNGGTSLWLPDETIRRVEELRQRNGHTSAEQVIQEAIDFLAQVKTERELAAYKNLSPRLREVLRMIAEGRSTKEIATQLKVSRKTVEFHRAQLVKKLGIRAVALITRYAVRVGAVLP